MSKKGDSRLKNVLHSSDALASALNSVERELNITAKDAASGQYSQIPNDVYRARYSLKSAYDQADDIDETVRATLGVAPKRRRNFKVERDYSFTPAAIQDASKQVLVPYNPAAKKAAEKAAEKAADKASAADSIPAAIESKNVVENAISAATKSLGNIERSDFSAQAGPERRDLGYSYIDQLLVNPTQKMDSAIQAWPEYSDFATQSDLSPYETVSDVVEDIKRPSTASLTASEERPADDTLAPVPPPRRTRGKGKATLVNEQLANVHVPIANPGESILDVAREAISGRPAEATEATTPVDEAPVRESVWTSVRRGVAEAVRDTRGRFAKKSK